MNVKLLRVVFPLILSVSAAPVFALGVYKWTDEAGVVHYSESAPVEEHHAVEVMTLDASDEVGNGLGISEEDDPEGYAAHREEMDQLWADLEEKKERARERKERQQRTEVVYVPTEPQYAYGYPWNAYRPPHKPWRPPARPQPQPEPAQPPTAVLDPSVFRR